MSRGRFITLEGGEGAGKSTQIARLADWLESRGLPVLRSREPGGSTGGEEIRKLLVDGSVDRWDPMSEALLHFAARRQHIVETLEPALAAGTWVLCDRFADSTMAYQGYGHALGPAVVSELYRLVVGDLRPDLTFVLDLPVAEGLARAGRRGTAEARYESMATAFHERVRNGFLEIARKDSDRCVVVDATVSAERVQEALREGLESRLGVLST